MPEFQITMGLALEYIDKKRKEKNETQIICKSKIIVVQRNTVEWVTRLSEISVVGVRKDNA